MIHIQIDPQIEKKIKKIHKTVPVNDSATDPKYLIPELEDRITEQLRKANPKDADRIVNAFLRRFFVDENGDVKDELITDYLFRRDIDRIVMAFWECVLTVWVSAHPPGHAAQIMADPQKYAKQLSLWNGSKERALEDLKEKKGGDGPAAAQKCISAEMLPFFDNITEEDLTASKVSNSVFGKQTKLKKAAFKFQQDIASSEKKKKTAKDKGALDILSDIFDYDLLSGSPRHEMMTAMEIPVCPYCNRQYITSYPDAAEHKTTADLDHYYCKSYYPYLALSLYNFVPSCQICNSRFKLAKDFYGTPHLYPYEPAPTSKVTFELGDAELLLNESAWDSPDVPFLSIETTGVAAGNSVDTFHLEQVYQSHKDYVHELVWKSKIYNEHMIASLQSDFSELFSSDKDVRDLLFGQYLDENEAHKRPLAKLTQDILKDLYDLDL